MKYAPGFDKNAAPLVPKSRAFVFDYKRLYIDVLNRIKLYVDYGLTDSMLTNTSGNTTATTFVCLTFTLQERNKVLWKTSKRRKISAIRSAYHLDCTIITSISILTLTVSLTTKSSSIERAAAKAWYNPGPKYKAIGLIRIRFGLTSSATWNSFVRI